MHKREHIFVALSGGVDSAVSAALLMEQGYTVTGAFIKIWQPEFIECTWREDRLDAIRVAATLGIPFREVDFSDVYKQEVIDDMLANYARGVTPNPDVLCNRFVKFGAFWQWAKREGATGIATGHHARVIHDTEQKRYTLMRGADANKDQTYFLWQLTQDDLAHTRMPVGAYGKEEVRRMAAERVLPVAKKPDSQGLCFVGDVSVHNLLQRFLETKPGIVQTHDGTPIGEHDGAALYTIGQRRAFRITDPAHAHEAHYVIATNIADNSVTVSTKPAAASRRAVPLTGVNWIGGVAPSAGEQLDVTVRYRQQPVACSVDARGGNVVLTCTRPVIATPGQSAVIYRGRTCIGGGIITA